MEDADFRAFIREERMRSDRVWREVVRELRELREASRAHSGEIRELSREIREMRYEGREIREEERKMRADARDEARAQREGLFKLIDEIRKLGEGPGPAPA